MAEFYTVKVKLFHPLLILFFSSNEPTLSLFSKAHIGIKEDHSVKRLMEPELQANRQLSSDRFYYSFGAHLILTKKQCFGEIESELRD